MYEAELKTAKQDNQKIRKQIREVDNEIQVNKTNIHSLHEPILCHDHVHPVDPQALAKILGDDAQDILHDAMHNLALPKSEVLKKEGNTTRCFSLIFHNNL